MARIDELLKDTHKLQDAADVRKLEQMDEPEANLTRENDRLTQELANEGVSRVDDGGESTESCLRLWPVVCKKKTFFFLVPRDVASPRVSL